MKIVSGHEYLVDLDRFTVRIRVLKRTSLGWECETIPIGTRVIIGEDAFRSDVAANDTSQGSHSR